MSAGFVYRQKKVPLKMKTNQSRLFGFTVVETIGVLVIVAILAILLIPRVSQVIDETKKRREGNLFMETNRVLITEIPDATGTNVSIRKVVGVVTVGNLTFLRTDGYYRETDSVRQAMMQVIGFEKAHPELEVTHRQMVVDPNFRVSFLLNHRVRATNLFRGKSPTDF